MSLCKVETASEEKRVGGMVVMEVVIEVVVELAEAAEEEAAEASSVEYWETEFAPTTTFEWQQQWKKLY